MKARTVVAAALVPVAVAALAVMLRDKPMNRVVAHFTAAVGVHEGSDVRVLGVKVGEVTSVRPEGRTVRVELAYDPQVKVPADAQALVVPPSVVADRYVQLAPAYVGGPALADGAELPVERTVVPIELDEIYRSLDDLNRALGPEGANKDGALSRLVDVGAANLAGNGQNLHETLSGLSQALDTLSTGRQDLFGTVVNLQKFTDTLAKSDASVREFTARMAQVGEELAAEKDELAAAIRDLASALAQITTFVRANRAELKANVAALADLTGVLVRQQQALREVLDVAPLALSNLNLAYNPRSGTTDTRDNAMGPYDPASFVCSLLVDSLPAAQVPVDCLTLAKALAERKLPLTDQLRSLLGGAK